jgi:hypothetical protein
MSFGPSVVGENIPTAEFGEFEMISAETACWYIESVPRRLFIPALQ